jgi:two-component system sensor histidine kinase ComP
MISLYKCYPQFLTFATNPWGQMIFAVIVLCAIFLFNSFFYVFRPYDGMGVSQETPFGEVYKIFPGGPADLAGVQTGDQILAIDNKSIDPLRSEPRYPAGVKAGDTIQFKFGRQGEQISLVLTIGNYSQNLSLLGSYLGIQILSIGFWIIGLVLTLFPAQEDMRARLLGLGFLIAGLTAAVGGASGWNSFWGANTIQKVLLSLLASIIVATHLNFPSISFSRYRKGIINLTFAFTFLLSVIVMINDWVLKPQGYPLSITYGVYLRQVIFAFFMFSWFVALALLIRNRFLSFEPEIRRQTGIIIWGMVLGAGPFFALTLLPYILFGQEYVAGSYTSLFLLLLPLAYAYVIFQRKLLKIDFIINRIVVWFILTLLILMASVLIFGVIVLIFDLPSQLPIFGGIVAVLIALTFTSLSKVVQTQVDRVLYGSHYDFISVTYNLSNHLVQALDRNRLVELLTQHLPQQMGIQQATLYLSSGTRPECKRRSENQDTLPMIDELNQALLEFRRPVRTAQLWSIGSSNVKRYLEKFDWGQVYVPLIVESKLQGILILGQRVNGDIYSDQDLHIIATVAEQGALAAANLELVDKLRGLTQQLVRSEEEQRKRLAGDLHDTALQELFYIKQGLRKAPNNPELIDYLELIIQNLRQVIQAQRPPLLDQGLPLALQGLVEDMQKKTDSSTSIILHSNVEGSLPLSDEQATSIFRITQEAINNAIKHAYAQIIEVKLVQDIHGVIHLQVKDDGIGMSNTDSDEKEGRNHFGLLLMQERATMIGSELKIHTHSDEGTTIVLEFQP